MIILYLLIIGFVVFAITRAAGPHGTRLVHHGSKEQSAMELLREKYINGEIDEETYLSKKKVIS